VSFLHITNGSAITPFMREAGIVGHIVPWDDVLHEGPVRAGLNVAAMREARADFLASCGWGSRDEIMRSLGARDAALEAASSGIRVHGLHVDEIVLWFEHDLYDQLQILQILDRLPLDGGPLLTAVPGDDYLVGSMPGLKPGPAGNAPPAGNPQAAGTAQTPGDSQSRTAGPGFSPGTRFSELFASRREVTSSQRIAARDAWDAFRSEDPRAIVDVLQRVSDLPHLPAALRRHLQQLPSVRNGFSRTEQQALEAIARDVTLLRDVFVQANHKSEEAVFMGDAAFLVHLRGLTQGPRPLVRAAKPRSSALSLDDHLALTEEGRRVLAGDADRVTLCGIDRWLGGVHIQGRGPVWRWHQARGTVVHV
jgi:hypothetical protein